MPHTSASPGTSRVVIVKVAPVASSTGPSAKVLETDLGALEVGEDRDSVAGLVGRLAHPAVGLLVVGVGRRGSC